MIRDATTQLLEYGTEKAEMWIEEKAVPAAKAKMKAGWENLKLFISAIKDSDKPIKATQIIAMQPAIVSIEVKANVVTVGALVKYQCSCSLCHNKILLLLFTGFRPV